MRDESAPIGAMPGMRRGGVLFRVGLAIGVVVVIAAAATISLTMTAMRWKPTISFNPHEELQALAENRQPESGTNGWVIIRDEVGPLIAEGPGEDARAPSLLLEGAWGRPAHEQPLERLAELREKGALDAIRRACRAPRFINPAEPPDEGLALYEVDPFSVVLTHARRATLILLAEARRRAETGDLAGAASDIGAVFALAQRVDRGPSMLHHLIAASIQSVALKNASMLILEKQLDDATLDTILEPLPSSGALHCGVSHALEAERISLRDFLQRAFTDDGEGSGWHIATWADDDSGLDAIANVWGYITIKRSEAERLILGRIDACREAYEAARSGGEVDFGKVEALRDEFTAAPGSDRVLPQYAAVNYAKMARPSLLLDARTDAFRLLAAIERHIDEHGAPPRTLRGNEAFAGVWPVRTPFLGEPVHYERLEEPDQHGRLFQLNWYDPDKGAPQSLSEEEERLIGGARNDLAPVRPGLNSD